MNAIEEGIEHHIRLEKIYAAPSAVEPEMPARIDWRAELQKIIDRQRPAESETDLTIDENLYRQALVQIEAILNGEKPRLIRTVFEETLRNDGVYEYTSTGSCDGSEHYYFRRHPALSANPTAWEPINGIPEGAKYNND